MAETKFGFNQMNRPAPLWFRKGKKIFVNTENLVLSVLLLCGFANDSLTLIIIKLGSSFFLENMEILLGNGQHYVPSNETIDKQEK